MNNRRTRLDGLRSQRMRRCSTLLLFLAALLPAPTGLTAPRQQATEDSDQPKVISAEIPEYPAILLAARICGSVKVEVKIDAQGTVLLARALGGHPLLYKKSEEASLKWRFEPAAVGEGIRTLLLAFDFDCSSEPVCKKAHVFVSPYHVRISYVYVPSAASETISYLPDDAEGKRCPVHRAPLKRDKVEIRYGLISFKEGYLKAEEKSFPYANTADYGGCVINVETNPCNGTEVQTSPKYAEVLYCEMCRLAQKRWVRSHPWPRK